MRLRLLAATLAVAFLVESAAAAGIDEVRAGNAAFGAGRYEAAVEAFTRGIQAGDLEADALAIAFNNRGVAYGELGDFDNAIDDYAEALRLKAGDPTSLKNLRIAHIRRGGAAATLGDADAALAEYGRAIEIDAQHPLAYLRRGQLRLNRGDVPGATTDLETARRLDPQSRDVAILLDQAKAAAPPAASSAPATPPAAPQATAAARPPATPPAAPPPPAAPTATVPAPAAAGPPPAPPTLAAPPPASSPAPPPQVADASPAPPAPVPARSDPLPAPAAGPPTTEAEGTALRAVADVNVRSGPGNGFAASGTLARGTEVTVLDQRLGWFRVRLPGGQEGYVYRRWLTADGTAD